jgi:hypothetical protein
MKLQKLQKIKKNKCKNKTKGRSWACNSTRYNGFLTKDSCSFFAQFIYLFIFLGFIC